MIVSGWYESEIGPAFIDLDVVDQAHAAHEIFNAVGDDALGADAEIEAGDRFSVSKMWNIVSINAGIDQAAFATSASCSAALIMS